MRSLAEAVSLLKGLEQGRPGGYEEIGSYMAGKFPLTMGALRLIDESGGRQRKGYSLVRRKNRKKGFVYYVRYRHEGKALPSKWNTHTNVREEAERFAVERREELVGRYLQAHNGRALSLLERFYADGSECLASETRRNRPLSERCRKEYLAVITGRFIPFLKARHIEGLAGITAQALAAFQDELLAGGLRPQTVNNKLKAVRRVLEHAAQKGMIGSNPARLVGGIPVRQGDQKARGCYEVGKLKGAFGRVWKDREAYMLG